MKQTQFEFRAQNIRITAPVRHPTVTESVVLPPITRVSVMQTECPSCQSEMMLARTTPGPPGYEFRTFACSRCAREVRKVAKLDPAQSEMTAGWPRGQLVSPN